MKQYPLISLIVLNYFGEKVLANTIKSIIGLNYPIEKLEIIIIDNNSQDQSRTIIEQFAKNYSQIKPLFLNKNLGFAKGNNQGFKIARGEYVAILNNDCVVDSNWLTELYKMAVKNPDAFAITSKIKLYKSNLIQNTGIFPFNNGYCRDIGASVNNCQQEYEEDTGQYDKELEVYAGCGAAMLFHKKRLLKLGGFEESFFMYYEDIDLCERARFSGYKIYYAPKAIVWHHHTLSSHEWSANFIYHSEKGRLLHLFFNFPATIFWQEYWQFSVKAIGRLLVYLPKYLINLAYLRVSLYFMTNILKLWLQRKARHKYSNKEVIKQNYQQILTGSWLFN